MLTASFFSFQSMVYQLKKHSFQQKPGNLNIKAEMVSHCKTSLETDQPAPIIADKMGKVWLLV